MTSSLIKAMTTADAVATVLDADRLSELLQRPVRAARLRIKPEVSVLVSLTDRSTGLTVGWARLLWPVSHSKAAQAERLAACLGLAQSPITRSLEEGLLLQCGTVLTDPKLAEPLAQATELGVLGTWEARDVLRYNPSRRLVLRDGATVLRLRTDGGGPADEVHRALSGRLPVPGLLDSQAVAQCEGRLSVQQWCGDTNLADFHADDAGGAASAQGLKEATRRVGALLAALHSCAGQLPADLVGRLPHQPAGSRELAEVHARQLDVLAPELARRVRAVGDMLPSHLSGTPVLTHGLPRPGALRVLDRADLADRLRPGAPGAGGHGPGLLPGGGTVLSAACAAGGLRRAPARTGRRGAGVGDRTVPAGATGRPPATGPPVLA